MAFSNLIGTVVSSKKGFIKVALGGKKLNCLLKSSLYKDDVAIRTGDIVDVRLEGQSDIDGIIQKVHERKNMISKPLVSNIDIALIVISFRKPMFTHFFLSKMILYLQMQNIKLAILFSKADLVEDSISREIYSCYSKENYLTFTSSLENDLDIKKYLQNQNKKTILLVGRSGSGKSTLVNKVFNLNLKTSVVSEKLKRGKHTTTSTTGYLVENENVIIDSPGFETLLFPKLTQDELARYFFSRETIDSFNCSFTTCRHLDSKHCKLNSELGWELVCQERLEIYKKLNAIAQKTKW